MKASRILLLLPTLACVSGATALAQVAATVPGQVRVVNATTIRQWQRPSPIQVLTPVESGTILDVIDREGDLYWVFRPRDAHGATRGGWIAVSDVEPVEAPPRPEPRASTAPAATAAPAAQEATPTPPRDVTRANPATDEAAPAPSYHFDDVLFDLNRATIKPEGAAILDQAATALMSDRLLRMTIEGHTCNLGTASYNLALGERRATAARDYLVSHGVAADRLHTVSYGETRPAHDNSTEESRRLNRRVVLVPESSR